MPAYIEVMERTHSLTSVSDEELLRRLSDLLGQSRRNEADLVAHIGEVDRRRLYAREASPSMFGYCTEILHLSEAEAYLRIAAARARARASPPPHPARRRTAAPDRHREAGAAPDPDEPGGHPEAGRSPVEARDRRARGGDLAPYRCSGGDAEAARQTSGDDVADPPARPARRGACRTASAGGFVDRPRPAELTRASLNCVQTESRGSGSSFFRPSCRCCPPLPGPGRRWSSPFPQVATRSSSLPPPSFTTSSSGCGPSCAPRCPTATSARSSSRPSPRSSRGSKPGVSLGPRSRGRRSPRARSPLRHARSRPR